MMNYAVPLILRWLTNAIITSRKPVFVISIVMFWCQSVSNCRYLAVRYLGAGMVPVFSGPPIYTHTYLFYFAPFKTINKISWTHIDTIK